MQWVRLRKPRAVPRRCSNRPLMGSPVGRLRTRSASHARPRWPVASASASSGSRRTKWLAVGLVQTAGSKATTGGRAPSRRAQGSAACVTIAGTTSATAPAS